MFYKVAPILELCVILKEPLFMFDIALVNPKPKHYIDKENNRRIPSRVVIPSSHNNVVVNKWNNHSKHKGRNKHPHD